MGQADISQRRRKWRNAAAVIVCWVGANVLALWLLDVCEAWRLSAEHRVSSAVIRAFDRRIVSVDVPDHDKPVSLAYRVRKPSLWTATGSMPLLVILHGSGERGYDGAQQLGGIPAVMCTEAWADGFPCAILAPQCPSRFHWSSPLARELNMTDILLQMIDDVLTDRRIDPQRVYLSGYSMGGYGAWSLAAAAPDRFAAVVPIAGGAAPDLAEALTEVPIWAVHSADDEMVPVEGTRQIVKAIQAAGGEPRYTELTDAGHHSWPEVFQAESAVLEWMFEQRTGNW